MTTDELIETLERLAEGPPSPREISEWTVANYPALITSLKESKAHADAMSALRLQLRGAREALVEARAAIQDWGSYAGKYFQTTHDLAGDLARIDAALQPQGDAKP